MKKSLKMQNIIYILIFYSIDNKDFVSKMEFFGAFLNNKLVGVISTRDKCHISLLFVNEEFHKQGIGKNLINYILKFNERNFQIFKHGILKGVKKDEGRNSFNTGI